MIIKKQELILKETTESNFKQTKTIRNYTDKKQFKKAEIDPNSETSTKKQRLESSAYFYLC